MSVDPHHVTLVDSANKNKVYDGVCDTPLLPGDDDDVDLDSHLLHDLT